MMDDQQDRIKSAIFKVGTEQEFFQRGKMLARLANQGEPLPEERTVSFEDPSEIQRLLMASGAAPSAPGH